MLTHDGPAALQYSVTEGYPPLREWVCEYLARVNHIECTPDQVLIISGSQQGLDLIGKVLLDPGDSVWMEEPGYRLARNVFTAAGCHAIPVPVDNQGLNVATGIKQCANARVACVTPSHQYPLGSTMSAARRMQ